MENDQWISKKELLQETGISYGQLYRWKRQNLIPDAWFVKQASFTGQETFFPKERILERVYAILDKKDIYSLEELAAMFSPEQSKRAFTYVEIGRWIDLESVSARALLDKYEGSLSFLNLLFFYMGNRLEKNLIMDEQTADRWAEATLSWIPKMQGTGYRLIILGNEKADVFLLVEHGTVFMPEPSVQVLVDWDMDKEAKQLATQVGERE
ncbi:MAG: YhbD family protein [Gorillibacterium sp.]|nr:YhbD family protein [Gorillibacterium sp.]